jgi:hypothetical protein
LSGQARFVRLTVIYAGLGVGFITPRLGSLLKVKQAGFVIEIMSD